MNPKAKVSSPTKSRLPASKSKPKGIDPNALPEFKPPTVKSVVQPTAPILPTEFAASEQRAMSQRLEALKQAMAEERAKREETMRQRELNPINQISGTEYRSQLKERLARKAEAMKEKQTALANMMKNVDLSQNPHNQPQIPTQSNKQSNNTKQSTSAITPKSITTQSMTIEQLNNPSSTYVPPVRSNDLSAFQAVSEKWLNDEKQVLIESEEQSNPSINWLDSLSEAQPAPRPVISFTNEPEPVIQSSLFDGDAFDEAESAKSFQEARLAWLASMQRPQTAKKDSSAGTINRDMPDSHSTNIITRPATASAGSLLDGPEFDESQSASSFADARKEWLASLNASNDVANQSSQTKQIAPRPLIDTADERFCCYHCYKLVPVRQCVMSRTGKPQQMCSEACRDKYEQSQREQAEALAKATAELVRASNSTTNGTATQSTVDSERVAPIEPVLHLSRPQTASSFDRPTTAMTGRVIHTVTESIAQPKPKVQFPDDD